MSESEIYCMMLEGRKPIEWALGGVRHDAKATDGQMARLTHSLGTPVSLK